MAFADGTEAADGAESNNVGKTYRYKKEKKRVAFEHYESYACGSKSCGPTFYTVPDGKRLELRYVSCNFSVNEFETAEFFNIAKFDGSGYFAKNYFPYSGGVPSESGYTDYQLNQAFFMIVEAGQSVRYSTAAIDDAEIGYLTCRVTGELVTFK